MSTEPTPTTLGDSLRRLAELADTGLLDGTSPLFTFHVEDPAKVQAVTDSLGGIITRYRSPRDTVQASNYDARVGSVTVRAIVATDTPWSDDGKSDEVWAAIVRDARAK